MKYQAYEKIYTESLLLTLEFVLKVFTNFNHRQNTKSITKNMIAKSEIGSAHY